MATCEGLCMDKLREMHAHIDARTHTQTHTHTHQQTDIHEHTCTATTNYKMFIAQCTDKCRNVPSMYMHAARQLRRTTAHAHKHWRMCTHRPATRHRCRDTYRKQNSSAQQREVFDTYRPQQKHAQFDSLTINKTNVLSIDKLTVLINN